MTQMWEGRRKTDRWKEPRNIQTNPWVFRRWFSGSWWLLPLSPTQQVGVGWAHSRYSTDTANQSIHNNWSMIGSTVMEFQSHQRKGNLHFSKGTSHAVGLNLLSCTSQRSSPDGKHARERGSGLQSLRKHTLNPHWGSSTWTTLASAGEDAELLQLACANRNVKW